MLSVYLFRAFDPRRGVRSSLHVYRGSELAGRMDLAAPVTVDNFEGVAVVRRTDGRIRFYIMSDDNAVVLQRTMLLAFDWQPKAASSHASTDEQQIREARVRSNAGIAAHDPVAIARQWLDDVHVVRSTGAQVSGRARNQERMAQQFATRPDTIYVRQPSAIDVYLPWGMASERGEWTGRWTEPDGVVDTAGTYMAQWRRVDGQWLIQAEIYVPTRCSGSKYCGQRP
jgi:ketosteroid isomerase-like protein